MTFQATGGIDLVLILSKESQLFPAGTVFLSITVTQVEHTVCLQGTERDLSE